MDGQLENSVIVLSFSFLFPREVACLNENIYFYYFPLTNESFISFYISVSQLF